jgi:hypothetical protein
MTDGAPIRTRNAKRGIKTGQRSPVAVKIVTFQCPEWLEVVAEVSRDFCLATEDQQRPPLTGAMPASLD